MRILVLFITVSALFGCGATQAQVDTALEINQGMATAYADQTVFVRGVFTLAVKHAPADKKKFWQDALKALDENAEKFTALNKDLMRLVLAMQQLNPAEQQRYVDQLSEIIVTIKTGMPKDGE